MKLVSLWHIARVPAIQTVAQRLNECYPLSPTLPHSLSLTATPRSTLPSSSPFLVCPSHRRRSPLARSRSSRPATAHALLLIVVSGTRRQRQLGQETVQLVNLTPLTMARIATLCPTCTVSAFDKHCSNNPRYCLLCCTGKADIITCLAHFRQMGKQPATTRVADRLVHQDVIDYLGLGEPSAASSSQERGRSASTDEAESKEPVGEPPGNTHDSTAAEAMRSIISLRSQIETDRAAADVANSALAAQLNSQKSQFAAMQAQLATSTQQTADTKTQLAAILALLQAQQATATPPQPAPSGPSLTALFTQTQPTPSPPLHRRTLLDAAVTTEDLLDQLSDGSTDEEAQQVTTTANTQQRPAVVLPAAFAPTPAGTEQSAQQQLAAILAGLNKNTSKVKYTSLRELNEALDDWAADSLRAGWTAAQIEAIRKYQHRVVYSLGPTLPLKDVLEYHRKWCKAVHNGDVDMFAKGADLNLPILHDVCNPQQFGSTAVSSGTRPARQRRPGKQADATATPADTKTGVPKAGTYPAGSCTNHPTSTTHTTAECKKK